MHDILLNQRQIGDLSLHHASCGDPTQPLVLLLHGFPEYWAAWTPQLKALGETHFAVAPDLRGFNLSDKPVGLKAYRASQIVSDVAALATSLGHDSFSLVAHDWGAAIAYAVAMAHPTRVKRMVIVNGVHPWAFARELTHSPEQAKASNYIELFRTPAATDELLANNCAGLQAMFMEDGKLPSWMTPDVLANYIRAWTTPGALEASLNYYRASSLHPGQADMHVDPVVTRVEAPVLQIWGERDRFLLTGCSERLEPVLPNLRTVRFAHGSHWLVHEEPEAVTLLIQEHLAPAL